MKKYAIISASLIISSCATPEKWEAITADPTPLESARTICQKETEQRYPVRMNYHVNLHNVSYINVNGKAVPINTVHTYPTDSNEMPRREYVNICMKLEGWENKNKVTGLLAFFV